jgi:acetyl-CoA carboxylase carboxyltransferase component
MNYSSQFESIKTSYNGNSARQKENFEVMQRLCQELKDNLKLASSQGQEKYLARHRERGKLLARDRVELLLDRDAPFLELMPLAGWEQEDMTLGGSIIAGLGVINGVLCLINANVPTEKGGALNEMSLLKSSRLDQIALENKLPMIYLTESAGADLPQQAKIFNYGGRAFREITRRSSEGIPSISVVFGSSTAGGAYIPGMSDYVIMVKGQAKTYLAGPPLVKMAINEDADDESLGGAMMHSRRSGLCDFLAENENDAIAQARKIVASFNWPKPQVAEEVAPPLYAAEELLDIVSADIKKPYDVREVIARLVDGSRFFEFKPLFGETLVTGWASLCGFPIGILANNGALFSDSANKGAHFIQLCNQRNIPLLFLQNITGFMVGKKAEEEGIIKNGAKLINAVSNSKVPALTVMIGASYGAGNYGMGGRAYAPRFLFAWPNAKLAVMGEEQLVGVMEIIQKEKMKKTGLMPGALMDMAKMKIAKDVLRKRIASESSAYYSTSRTWDDGIIDPRETRAVLGLCLAAINQGSVESSPAFGVFRM